MCEWLRKKRKGTGVKNEKGVEKKDYEIRWTGK